jgi:phosphoserine aminotransferase
MTRIHNFSAGPAVLPEPVLREAQSALLEFGTTGIGIMEMSHRTKPFEDVVASAKQRLRRLLRLSDDQEILFLSGGASTQFFMGPMNLLRGGRAAYLETGHWAEKAIKEAKRFGTIDIPFTSRDTNFDRVPEGGEWSLPDGTTYLHYTSNNTIYGTQFSYVPDAGNALLVCDASSDILSGPIEGSKLDILYAGAQKNLGPSGITVVVFRKTLFERCDPNLPTMLRYAVHAENDSMYNTPNTWGIFFLERVCAWMEASGGAAAIGAANRRRADSVYATIDASGLWKGTCKKSSRSIMNLTFTTGNPDFDMDFCKQADKQGLSGLKGHRAVGGLRASLYNAQTDAAVAALVDFMREFERRRG